METERRVNLRFADGLYEQLDRKRFEQGSTFQAIGTALFMEWLRGKRTPSTHALPEDLTADELDYLDAVIKFLREDESPGMRDVFDTVLLRYRKKKGPRRV